MIIKQFVESGESRKMSVNSSELLKVQSAILIQLALCQIQQLSSHGPPAVRSVRTGKCLVFVHSSGSVIGQTKKLTRSESDNIIPGSQ